MKIRKLNIILTSVVIFCLSCLTAFAEGPVNTDKPVEIEVNCFFEDIEMRNMYLELYKVADADSYGNLRVTENFSEYGDILSISSREEILQMADELNRYVISNNIKPSDRGNTDSKGNLVFPVNADKLTAGLYLVSDGHHIQGDYIYESKPFIVYLPLFTNGESIYSVKLSPKYSRTPVDDVYTKITVVKVWKDKGYENIRPDEITVKLYNGKTVHDTVVLSDANDWRHTWRYLDKTGDWSVAETANGDYTTKIEKDGTAYIITNTYKNPPKDPELPDTGQNWMPSMVLFAAGLVLVIAGIVCRQTGGYEE